MKIADKAYAEEKDKIEELFKLGIKVAELTAKYNKAMTRNYQLKTVKDQQRDIFKDMQDMYAMAAKRAASDSGNLKSVSKAFQVTDENMRMTDYDAIKDEAAKAEAMENIVLLG
jgi:hypothetical protein